MFRRLNDQNYYQVLEVSYDASSEEIQSAYETARDIYSHDALVSGSILSEHERRRTFDRIAEAYQTLIAEESRRLYDRKLGLPETSRNARRQKTGARAPEPRTADAATEPIKPSPSRGTSARRCPIQLSPSEEATGAFLRQAREALGLELATISEETKIGRAMLEYIEDERLDRLPAPVYLRNFTRQIARCLGLDEERVSSTYLERIRRAGT